MLLVCLGRSLVCEGMDILGDRFVIEIRGDRLCEGNMDFYAIAFGLRLGCDRLKFLEI
jgi:hypothetical protein